MSVDHESEPRPVPGLKLIVAAASNDVIGVEGDLPWRLSADLRRFKRLTMGHPIIMGRKTFESLGRLLPGRETVIVTRNEAFAFSGARVVHSVTAAIDLALSLDATAFLIGGAEIYDAGLPWVSELEMTRVHVTLDGDAWLPAVDWSEWELVDREDHEADERNEYPYSFLRYRRRVVPERPGKDG